MSIFQDFINSVLPFAKNKPNGWKNVNCVACIHRGETTPDQKLRLGFLHEPNGSVRISCFRCAFYANWSPGMLISNKLKQLFSWLNIDEVEVKNLELGCLKLKNDYDIYEENSFDDEVIDFKVILPPKSNSFTYWSNHTNIPSEFINSLEYLINRNEKLIYWFNDWNWSPELPNHIIMPIYHYGQLVGYTARNIDVNSNAKYLLHKTEKTLFNIDLVTHPTRKKIILVEGPLDAIAISGVAILGNTITKHQQDILKGSDKEIIVLPDRDAGGQKLIDSAIKNNWSVSLPNYDTSCKDALDLVNKYGRIMAIKMIFDSVISNSILLDIERKKW